MIVLAIDQSLTSTGYAVLDYKEEGRHIYRTWGRITTKKTDLGRTEDRINKIVGELAKIASKFEPDWIVIERPIMRRGVKTAQDLAGLYYVIACKLIRMGFSVTTVVNTTWKKGVGIEGKDSKEQKESSKKRAYELVKKDSLIEERWCKLFNSDDETDAVCMAWYWAKWVENEGGEWNG